jgi:hypothetical protein
MGAFDINAGGVVMTPSEIMQAQENGRQCAAEALRCNPERLRYMESKYTKEFCMNRYPEAYRR